MLSFHRKVVYPTDTDIADFDLDTDVEEYNYDGRLVFRGNLDPAYSGDNDEFQVYWLYDESNQRVGLAEHRGGGNEHTCYWIRDNVYSTMFQEDGWTCRDRTLWNIMAPSAYEDCMRNGWTTVDSLRSRTSLTIVRPQDVLVYEPPDALCIRCGSSEGKGHAGCQMEKHEPRYDVFFTLFVDDDGLIYVPPADTRAYGAALPTLRRPLAAGALDSEISTIVGVGAATGAGAGAGAGAAASSSSPSSSSSSSETSAALAPPATGTGASPSSSSSLNISRAV